jgi:hypothetical protein
MPTTQTKPDTWKLLADIRNAVGLSGDEKVFLYNIVTHKTHKEFGSRKLVMQRTGLTDHKFRKVTTALLAAQLIKKQRGLTVTYTIDLKGLAAVAKSTRLVSAVTTTSSGNRQPPIGGVQHGTRVAQHHQKKNTKHYTEDIQKTTKNHDLDDRRRTVRVPVELAEELQLPRRQRRNAREMLLDDHDLNLF